MDEPLLRFSIVKRFRGFSLECEAAFESGVTAVFGPSGSGKTTLLNCIAGLVRPDAGEIEAMGQVLFSSSRRKNVPPEKRRFGYVFQDSALFPHKNVRENIAFGYKLTRPERRKIEPELLVELFQLSPLLDRRVTNLSGGERQRVALARALASSPDLLLLDEPLASLDGGLRGVIIAYLKRVRRELGTPMIYISHSISEVMALADNALVLAKGRPVVQGRPSQVLVHPGLSAVADYATLENILEAEVASNRTDEGLAQLRIGKARLTAPDVYRRPGETVMVSIRAGDVILTLELPPKMSARNVIDARIQEIHVVGPRVLIYLDIGAQMMAEITPTSLRELDLREGQHVYLIIKTNSILVLDVADQASEPHPPTPSPYARRGGA